MVVGPMSSDERARYRIFGLTVASDIPLPEATMIDPPMAENLAETEISVELGEVPPSLPEGRICAPWLEFKGAACLLRFEGIGRFLVEQGRRIVVEKALSASYDDLRGFLFGSAFGAVVHQRGLVPLHVSAVATPKGAVAFTGESGAGKSTLAALLNKEMGWPLICDDVAVLGREADEFHLASGVNTVKLWQDALQTLDRSSEGLRRDLTRYDKFHAILAQQFFNGRLALKHLVLLKWGNELKLEPVSGRRAYQIVLAAIYRPEFAALFSNRAEVSAAAMALAATTKVTSLVRPRSSTDAKATANHIASTVCTDPLR